MRRRQRIGKLMIVGGPLLPVSAIAFPMFAPSWIWTHVSWHKVDVSYLMFTVVLVLSAPVFIGAGIRLQQTSPSVVIIDSGEGTLLFRFKSQMFRNYFAELNGEDFKRSS